MNEILSIILITIGVLFDLFGTVGLVRLPDLYNRLQAATKSVTLGTCSILLGIMVNRGLSAVSMKALLCIIFILLTTPTAAHALARAAHIAGVPLWSKSVCDRYAEDKKGKEDEVSKTART